MQKQFFHIIQYIEKKLRGKVHFSVLYPLRNKYFYSVFCTFTYIRPTLQECVFQHEEDGENDGTDVERLIVATEKVEKHPCDKSHEDAVGDGICERHEGDAHEAWDGCEIVAEIDFANVVHHHHSHEYESWSCGLARNGEEQRREEQGKDETYG